MQTHRRPRIMITGERSGVGKSTITIGIMAALKARGLDVQPFKNGPDFLDPMHHDSISRRRSRNLDTWMFPGYVKESFMQNSTGADISVMEGSMGFYDGYDGIAEEGSSAHLSKVLQTPAILVLDATASARSLGAVAKGFIDYDPNVNIAGVIFNHVAGPRHLEMLKASLRGVECLGGLPSSKGAELKSRHLGLVPAQEEDNSAHYRAIQEMIERDIDMDRLVQIASEAVDIEHEHLEPRCAPSARCRIGVAQDAAFNFYYQDNFDLLRQAGAEIVPFSPLRDQLPDVDGVYIGGGFPELFARQLSDNYGFLRRLAYHAFNDMPIYAECGGLMYLCKSIKDLEGQVIPMAAIFDAKVEMTEKLQSLGYVQASSVRDNLIMRKGASVKGHVFHYSRAYECGEERFAYKLDKDKGIAGNMDGFLVKNTLASYTHLHFGADLNTCRELVNACGKFSRH
jgi:cobyrinic acid a,c-diamide synthase